MMKLISRTKDAREKKSKKKNDNKKKNSFFFVVLLVFYFRFLPFYLSNALLRL